MRSYQFHCILFIAREQLKFVPLAIQDTKVKGVMENIGKQKKGNTYIIVF